VTEFKKPPGPMLRIEGARARGGRAEFRRELAPGACALSIVSRSASCDVLTP
jgi:hypothetical protein